MKKATPMTPKPERSEPRPRALLTVKEAAAYLAVSPAWLRDHATRRTPRIPAVKLGTGPRAPLRFKPADLENWIAKLPRVK